jgi:ribosomal protein L11 methyltransferase
MTRSFDPCDDPGVIQRAKQIVTESEFRITPRDFARRLAMDAGIAPGQARTVLKHLISTNELTYSYDFGATHVEPSFAKPVKVTAHFVLSPWKTENQGFPNQDPLVEIVIAPGISFGSGRHPTTRLCLEAIDHALLSTPCADPPGRAADVGTGSGVLALALVRAGCPSCLALDTDLNCVSEALTNVTLNHLTDKITVTPELLDPYHGKFSVIAANLRFPTLKNLAGLFSTITDPHALLILSGVRTTELDDLIHHYGGKGFTASWTQSEKNWSAAIFKKTWKP